MESSMESIQSFTARMAYYTAKNVIPVVIPIEAMAVFKWEGKLQLARTKHCFVVSPNEGKAGYSVFRADSKSNGFVATFSGVPPKVRQGLPEFGRSSVTALVRENHIELTPNLASLRPKQQRRTAKPSAEPQSVSVSVPNPQANALALGLTTMPQPQPPKSIWEVAVDYEGPAEAYNKGFLKGLLHSIKDVEALTSYRLTKRGEAWVWMDYIGVDDQE